MKKSLVALAVLAASGASFAQSTVTVYGVADVFLGSARTNDGIGTSTSTSLLNSGGVATSRWGLKGTEDLGGGLKANFLLEQGFSIDTGAATAGQAFSRQSYVGFSGGFGEVRLGKAWTAYDDVSGASDAVFDSALSPMNTVFKSTGYTGNPSNGIRYSTPAIGGFSAAVSYSLDEKTSGAAAVAPATAAALAVPGTTAAQAAAAGVAAGLAAAGVTATGLSVAYAGGPLSLTFGYQNDARYQGNILFASYTDQKFTRLGATYDFGVATAKLTYGKVANLDYVSGFGTTEWQIGADVPVSSVLTLSASYAKSDDNAAAGNKSRKGLGIGASYTLSKRTFLYGGYVNTSATQAPNPNSTANTFALGVNHSF